MDKTPPYSPTDPGYWDKKGLQSEIERVFSLCADCRLCVKFCGSFPKMFDAIDRYCTDEKYAEVDTKKLKTEDVDEVVDLCFQCKLCYIKCPYTPGNHEWSIDFPRLMARAKAQRVKEAGLPLPDKVLGKPDLVGKVGSWTARLANWANENKIHRQLIQASLGIHKDKKLPLFAWKTFASRFQSTRKEIQGAPAAKIAFFSTCYVNYNEPGLGMDTLEVMARNNVDVAFAYEQCCGMPSWHNGDMASAVAAAEKNVQGFARHIVAGRIIVATNPTCSQMIRVEYPRLLGTKEAKLVAGKTMDPTEFLASLAAQGKLNRDFKTSAGKINYHMPCHLRAQNIGYKSRDVLSLLPGTKVRVIEECSGHDGTWAMKKENFENSLKWGGRAFRGMIEGDPDVTCSDCPLAAIQIEQGTGRRPLNPMQILAKSYRGEQLWEPTKPMREKPHTMSYKSAVSKLSFSKGKNLDRLETACRRKGVPLTVQRRLVMEVLLNHTDHPTVDQVFEEVKNRIPGISRTTVYRVLETLVGLGVVRRTHHFGAVARFDGNIEHHHHLVCLGCGKVVDFQDADRTPLHVPEAQGTGFEITDYSVYFEGLCAECRKHSASHSSRKKTPRI